MTTRMGDHLAQARRRQFVGRTIERALFQSLLSDEESPFQVLHVYGPGGVGKTSLLRAFADIAAQWETPVFAIDARNVDPSPELFMASLGQAVGVTPPDSPIEALGRIPGRFVLLIDTYELLTPLDPWMRDGFLPQLPDSAVVVLAGRNAPAPEWRSDPGWQTFIRTLPLRNLSPDESRSYLANRNVPGADHQAVLDFTHGHPLALSLVADAFAQRADAAMRFDPEAAPDIVKTLVEHFVQKVPSPSHRAALEACALVRLTTEPLLAMMLDLPDAHEQFDWLRGLSFVESGRQGLFPHDTAREVLVADLRWRNPDWYAELHHRARRYYGARLAQTQGLETQRVLFDYVYLHRDNPIMRPYLEWQESGSTMPDSLRPGDEERLMAMVRAHEGPESARWLDHWLERQPQGAIIYRDAEGEPIGFMYLLSLADATPEDRDADPVTRAAWRYLAGHAPLRSDRELALLFRFWMARDSYQSVSAVQSLIFGRAAQYYLTTPGLAFSFFLVADPDFWEPMFGYVDLTRAPEAEATIGDRRYAAFCHDWRVVSPTGWLDLLAQRELAAEPAPPPPQAPSVVLLSQPDFAAAVRDALRNLTRPEALRNNPLLRSRLVVERAGGKTGLAERVETLRALAQEATERLKANPRQVKLYRALYHTYLHPAPTQEQAAELIDLPFSTYRRHLAAGVAAVVECWWNWELQGTTG